MTGKRELARELVRALRDDTMRPTLTDAAEIEAFVIACYWLSVQIEAHSSARRALTEGLRWARAVERGVAKDAEESKDRFKTISRIILEDRFTVLQGGAGGWKPLLDELRDFVEMP